MASWRLSSGYDRDTCKTGNGTQRGRWQPPYPAGEWSSASRRSCSSYPASSASEIISPLGPNDRIAVSSPRSSRTRSRTGVDAQALSASARGG